MIAEDRVDTPAAANWAATEEAGRLRAQFHRIPALLKGLPCAQNVPDHVEAAVLDIEVTYLRRCRHEFRTAVDSVVAEALVSPALGAQLERLRARYAAANIVCLGDSITADHQSWAEMLALALGPEVSVVNEGRSGDTTTDLVSRFHASVPQHRPGLVIVHAGTNDARTYRGGSQSSALTEDQTRRNLAELAALAASLGAGVLWVTPGPVDDVRVNTHPNTVTSGARWSADGCRRVAAIVRERSEPVADLQMALADAAQQTDLLLPDGLHPNLAGQALIFATVTTALETSGDAQ